MGGSVDKRALEKRRMVRSSFFFGTATMISKLNQCRDDAKSVAIVALGCFHPVTKVQSASLHFFLGGDEESEDSEDESEDDVGSKAQ